MVQPEVVIGFLQFKDWGLMLVMGSAAGLAMLAYKGFPRWLSRPLLGGQFLTQPASWNRQTVIGSAIFGIGWELSGVCPGPAIPVWAPATPTSFGLWAGLRWALWPMAGRRGIDCRTSLKTPTDPPQVRIMGLAQSHILSFQTQFL